jgi:hypothetical protein
MQRDAVTQPAAERPVESRLIAHGAARGPTPVQQPNLPLLRRQRSCRGRDNDQEPTRQ